MSTFMDFTPEKNQLSAYLNQRTPFSLNEPMKKISTQEELEQQFNNMKQKHAMQIQDLQKRLEICLNFHRDTWSQLELSRSIIKRERNSLSIQRYEGLLQQNFKQIEWIQTSRLRVDGQIKERNDSVDKVEQKIELLEQQIIKTQNNQKQMLKEIEQTVESESNALSDSINHQTQNMLKNYRDIEEMLTTSENQFKNELNDLNNHLSNTSQQLATIMQNQISSIEEELSLCSS